MELKIADFGLAAKIEFYGEVRKTVCGTPNYIAPEVIDGKGHSYEVDVWAVGVIAYTLLEGKPPFETKDINDTYSRIKRGDYSYPPNIPISNEAKSLIDSILILEPRKRPSFDEILSHPFFQMGLSIPKLIPVSTLCCHPSISYIRQFMPNYVDPDDKSKSGPDTTAPKPSNLSIKIITSLKKKTIIISKKESF